MARLARDLRQSLPEATQGDLSRAMVIFPSARACRTLGNVLLETGDRDVLLLPRIMTPGQLLEEAAAALGKTATDRPDDRLRPLLLADALASQSWLRERPESAPGLATEFCALFDEIRLYGVADLMLDPQRQSEVLSQTGAAEAEIIAAELQRIQEVWSLYRQILPEDDVDHTMSVVSDLADNPIWPAPQPAVTLVAGFGRLDPLRAQFLRLIMQRSESATLYLPEATSQLSELLGATWSADQSGTHPLAAGQMIRQRLTDHPPEPSVNVGPSLRERLQSVGAPENIVAPDGPLRLLPCADPETESARVVHEVVQVLSAESGAQLRTAVATADPQLAARITSQLRSAGIDCDDSHGQPLSTLPAGLLLRFILRAALTDLQPQSLLDVLTHPYVQLPVREGSREMWTLRLEKMFRLADGPKGGLAALQRRAQERDAAAVALFQRQGTGLTDFVATLVEAFDPLLTLTKGCHTWPKLLTALQQTWSQLTGDHDLIETPDASDITAAARLVTTLQRDGHWLAETSLGDFAADLGRLLARESVPAHRARNLPVQVLGLVEARLEQFDTLIVAGLTEGVFPARTRRPLFLNARLRENLGLPVWRETRALDSELFLRLLHNGQNVILTWSVEAAGQPMLPSSFVSRLTLALGLHDGIPVSEPVPLWRQSEDIQAFTTTAYATPEALDPGAVAHAEARPLLELSWSSLNRWRECPYRSLLEKGFALRREEEVRAEFGRKQYGTLAHDVMCRFLDPTKEGHAALIHGDATAALDYLQQTAQAVFLPGVDDLPIRRLWMDNLLRGGPAIVEFELARFADWHPIRLEENFQLGLPRLWDWVVQTAADLQLAVELPPTHDRVDQVLLRGTIDRIDQPADRSDGFSVIDYKTGKVPTLTQITTLQDLQVPLYALAVEIGALNSGASVARVHEGFYYSLDPKDVGMKYKGPHLGGRSESDRRLLVDCGAALVRLAAQASAPEAKYPLLQAELNGEGQANLPCGYCDHRGVCRVEDQTLPPEIAGKMDKLVNQKLGWS